MGLFGKDESGVKYSEAPENVFPICPKCNYELKEIWTKSRGLGLLEKQTVIICPKCRVLLGYGNINYT